MTEQRIIRQRPALGLDRDDEVEDGAHVASPLPNDEHQELVGGIPTSLTIAIQYAGLGEVRPGVAVSDREHNDRGPDVIVFLNDTEADCHGAFRQGGPDFALEVVSRHGRSRQHLDCNNPGQNA